jgi:hypothetical protein
MTEGACPTCGAVSSTPMYSCRCGTLSATAGPVDCQDGICRPRAKKPFVDLSRFTREQLGDLRELLKEGAP